jgi:hypothetical protein
MPLQNGKTHIYKDTEHTGLVMSYPHANPHANGAMSASSLAAGVQAGVQA